jgi:hypothetical protein
LLNYAASYPAHVESLVILGADARRVGWFEWGWKLLAG